MEALKEYTAQESAPTAISIIESVDLNSMKRQVRAITDFQELVHSQFRQDHDFVVIPGTKKPTPRSMSSSPKKKNRRRIRTPIESSRAKSKRRSSTRFGLTIRSRR